MKTKTEKQFADRIAVGMNKQQGFAAFIKQNKAAVMKPTSARQKPGQLIEHRMVRALNSFSEAELDQVIEAAESLGVNCNMLNATQRRLLLDMGNRAMTDAARRKAISDAA